jgi:hypothetical protein
MLGVPGRTFDDRPDAIVIGLPIPMAARSIAMGPGLCRRMTRNAIEDPRPDETHDAGGVRLESSPPLP